MNRFLPIHQQIHVQFLIPLRPERVKAMIKRIIRNVGRLCVSGDRVAILIYHRVLASPDALRTFDINVDDFRDQMKWVRECFHVLPLYDVLQGMRNEDRPLPAVAITFDDGYRDNVNVALPVLKELGLHATFFIASGYLNGGMMWNDGVIEYLRTVPDGKLDLGCVGMGKVEVGSLAERRRLVYELLNKLKYLPFEERESAVNCLRREGHRPSSDLMMRDEDVRRLHREGMEIGGHTRNHPILSRLESAQAYMEIVEGRRDLESLDVGPIRLFAYPNGKFNRDYNAEHVEMVKEIGFEAAVSTDVGVASSSSDQWQLPRFTPWDKAPWRFSVRLLEQYRHPR